MRAPMAGRRVVSGRQCCLLERPVCVETIVVRMGAVLVMSVGPCRRAAVHIQLQVSTRFPPGGPTNVCIAPCCACLGPVRRGVRPPRISKPIAATMRVEVASGMRSSDRISKLFYGFCWIGICSFGCTNLACLTRSGVWALPVARVWVACVGIASAVTCARVSL